MASYFLAAGADGCYRSQNRSDVTVNCADLAGSPRVIEWPSSLSAQQRTHLTGQWLNEPDGLLYDEWIPDEWLLRAYATPAMAAVDLKRGELGSRVFEIEADPVVLGRSIRVVIPELGLAGVRQFRVGREVPGWWLYGPRGSDVLTLLRQYHQPNVMERVLAAALDHQAAWRSHVPVTFLADVLAVADATRRVGAVTLASTLTRGVTAHHGRLAAGRAFQSAVGLIMRDVLPEARVLYEPWLAIFGSLPANTATVDSTYPCSAELGA